MWMKLMRVVVAALALAGLTVSVLALKVHNLPPDTAPPCAVNEHWDCGSVNHSRFADFPPRMIGEESDAKKVHVPVAIIGIAGYIVMFTFAAFGRWWIVLQLAEIGFAAACFLTYLEAFVIEKWCIYCVWSQAIVTTIMLCTAIALILQRRSRSVVVIP